jgi:hypothetical protein
MTDTEWIHVTVLECANGKWVITSGRGYRPFKTVGVFERRLVRRYEAQLVETLETCKYMYIYGVNNVRGGPFRLEGNYTVSHLDELVPVLARELHVCKNKLTRRLLRELPVHPQLRDVDLGCDGALTVDYYSVCARCGCCEENTGITSTNPLCRVCVESVPLNTCGVCNDPVALRYHVLCALCWTRWDNTHGVCAVTRLKNVNVGTGEPSARPGSANH